MFLDCLIFLHKALNSLRLFSLLYIKNDRFLTLLFRVEISFQNKLY